MSDNTYTVQLKRADEVAEELLQAMQLLIDKRIEDLKFDKTEVCTIITVPVEAAQPFQVTIDGISVFEAYSDVTTYGVGDQVLVSFPADDTRRKIILSRYSVDETALDFTFNKERFATAANGKIVSENNGSEEFTFRANSADTTMSICPLKVDIDASTLDNVPGLSAIYNQVGLFNACYLHASVISNFMITNKNGERKHILPYCGDYGLIIKIILQDKEKSFYFGLDANTMLGNPYAFEGGFEQDVLYKFSLPMDIPITAIEAYAYSNNNFYYYDDNKNSIKVPSSENCYIGFKDITLGIGFDVSQTPDDKVVMYAEETRVYKDEYQLAASNKALDTKKTLHLLYLNKDANNKYLGFNGAEWNQEKAQEKRGEITLISESTMPDSDGQKQWTAMIDGCETIYKGDIIEYDDTGLTPLNHLVDSDGNKLSVGDTVVYALEPVSEGSSIQTYAYIRSWDPDKHYYFVEWQADNMYGKLAPVVVEEPGTTAKITCQDTLKNTRVEATVWYDGESYKYVSGDENGAYNFTNAGSINTSLIAEGGITVDISHGANSESSYPLYDGNTLQLIGSGKYTERELLFGYTAGETAITDSFWHNARVEWTSTGEMLDAKKAEYILKYFDYSDPNYFIARKSKNAESGEYEWNDERLHGKEFTETISNNIDYCFVIDNDDIELLGTKSSMVGNLVNAKYTYKIKEFYNPSTTYNAITCKAWAQLSEGGVAEGEDTEVFSFATFGASGTDYSIVFTPMDGQQMAIKVVDKGGKNITTSMQYRWPGDSQSWHAIEANEKGQYLVDISNRTPATYNLLEAQAKVNWVGNTVSVNGYYSVWTNNEGTNPQKEYSADVPYSVIYNNQNTDPQYYSNNFILYKKENNSIVAPVEGVVWSIHPYEIIKGNLSWKKNDSENSYSTTITADNLNTALLSWEKPKEEGYSLKIGKETCNSSFAHRELTEKTTLVYRIPENASSNWRTHFTFKYNNKEDYNTAPGGIITDNTVKNLWATDEYKDILTISSEGGKLEKTTRGYKFTATAENNKVVLTIWGGAKTGNEAAQRRFLEAKLSRVKKADKTFPKMREHWDNTSADLNFDTADVFIQRGFDILHSETVGWSIENGGTFELVNITVFDLDDRTVTTLQSSDTLLDNSANIAIEARKNEKLLANIPIYVGQNRYESELLNNWDGGLQIDEKGNYILGSMFAAGRKEKDNSFTGVAMGERATLGETTKYNDVGLFGFESGVQTFEFNTNGTAKLGRTGKGQIIFNGNEGVIKTNGWQSTVNTTTKVPEYTLPTDPNNEKSLVSSGTVIDLDDAVLVMQDKNPQHYLKFNNGGEGVFELGVSGTNINLSDKNQNVSAYIDVNAGEIISEVRRTAQYYATCNTESINSTKVISLQNFSTGFDNTGKNVPTEVAQTQSIKLSDVCKAGVTIAVTFTHPEIVEVSSGYEQITLSQDKYIPNTYFEKNAKEKYIIVTDEKFDENKTYYEYKDIIYTGAQLQLQVSRKPDGQPTESIDAYPIYLNGMPTGKNTLGEETINNPFGWSAGSTIYFTCKDLGDEQFCWEVIDSGAYSRSVQTDKKFSREIADTAAGIGSIITQTAGEIAAEVRRTANYYATCSTENYTGTGKNNEKDIKLVNRKDGVTGVTNKELFQKGVTLAVTFIHEQTLLPSIYNYKYEKEILDADSYAPNKYYTYDNDTEQYVISTGNFDATAIYYRQYVHSIEAQGHPLYLSVLGVSKPIYLNNHPTGPYTDSENKQRNNPFSWKAGSTVYLVYDYKEELCEDPVCKDTTNHYHPEADWNNSNKGYWRVGDSGSYSKITETADMIQATVATESGRLESQITQTARKIKSEVKQKANYYCSCVSVSSGTDTQGKTAYTYEISGLPQTFFTAIEEGGIGGFTNGCTLMIKFDAITVAESHSEMLVYFTFTEQEGTKALYPVVGSPTWETGETLPFVYTDGKFALSALSSSKITETANAIMSEVSSSGGYAAICKEYDKTNTSYIAQIVHLPEEFFTFTDLFESGVTLAITFDKSTFYKEENDKPVPFAPLKLTITDVEGGNAQGPWLIYYQGSPNTSNGFKCYGGDTIFVSLMKTKTSGTYWVITDSGAYSNIIQTAGSIRSELSAVDGALRSYIDQQVGSITLSVSDATAGDTISSTFTLTADKTELSTAEFKITGLTTFVNSKWGEEWGKTTIDGGKITTGTISADRIDVSGVITAGKAEIEEIAANSITVDSISASNITAGTISSTDGSIKIAGWKVYQNGIYSSDDTIFLNPNGDRGYVFKAGNNFKVSSSGVLTCSGADIGGTVRFNDVYLGMIESGDEPSETWGDVLITEEGFTAEFINQYGQLKEKKVSWAAFFGLETWE